MKTPRHHFERIKRSPEWQAWKRQCEIDDRQDAIEAEAVGWISATHLVEFSKFASQQRALHIILLCQNARMVSPSEIDRALALL
jgi:hypothetical protein